MRRRAFAILLLTGVAGAVACTTFGGEDEEITPAPTGDAAPESSSADGAISDGGLPGDDELAPPLDAGPLDDASACANRCRPGTTCAVGDTCLVTSQPTCDQPIVVAAPGRYVGRACKVDGTKLLPMCGENRTAHVFLIGPGVSKVAVKAGPGSNLEYAVGATCGSGSCGPVSTLGGPKVAGVAANDLLFIGVTLCGNYELVFSK